MFYRVCLSVHANALRTAGTQAPTAPRWPHHYEYCMMGTWGDEIISKGNPIIFSPTLHLFHISSLSSSISPPSFKRESGMTHPFTPLPWCLLTARVRVCVFRIGVQMSRGLFSFFWLSSSGWQKTPASLVQAADIFSQKRWACCIPIYSTWVPRLQEDEEMPCLRMLACVSLV